MATKSGPELLKYIVRYAAKCKNFEAITKNVQILQAEGGRCLADFKVEEEHLNQVGGLHGGYTATVLENITTYAVLSKSGILGVTVDLHVFTYSLLEDSKTTDIVIHSSYLKGARLGDEVVVDADTIKVGKSLAYVNCELRHKSDNSIIARGTQTMFVGFPPVDFEKVF